MRIRTARELGIALRERRRALGLDQQALARQVGVTRQWIIAVERGRPRAPIDLVLRTVQALGLAVSVEEVDGPVRRAPGATPPAADLDAVIERARGGKR